MQKMILKKVTKPDFWKNFFIQVFLPKNSEKLAKMAKNRGFLAIAENSPISF